MRAFIAIPLPENIKDYLDDIQKEFRKCEVSAKWVNIRNAHLTLKFLGEVKEEMIPPIENVIKEIAEGLSIIRVNFSSFGFFPGKRNPRVFFVSTDKEEMLRKTAYAMEEKLKPLGFKQEHRFKSHITLARLKEKKNAACLITKSKEIKPDKSFNIESIVLYKSVLTSEGPIYEEIFSAEF